MNDEKVSERLGINLLLWLCKRTHLSPPILIPPSLYLFRTSCWEYGVCLISSCQPFVSTVTWVREAANRCIFFSKPGFLSVSFQIHSDPVIDIYHPLSPPLSDRHHPGFRDVRGCGKLQHLLAGPLIGHAVPGCQGCHTGCRHQEAQWKKTIKGRRSASVWVTRQQH